MAVKSNKENILIKEDKLIMKRWKEHIKGLLWYRDRIPQTERIRNADNVEEEFIEN